jgi:hypothetical protein
MSDEPTLESLAAIANHEHACGEEATHKSLSHFRAAGDALIKAKRQVGHGKFKSWVEANVRFSYRTARDYMRLAKYGEKWQHAASLRDALDLIANGDKSRLVRAERRKAKRQKNDETRRRLAEAAQPTDLIRVGDFREVLTDLPDESVDLLFTDPPYAKEFYPLYGALAELGSRVLKVGGSLVAYAPTYALADILPLMVPHLRYWNEIIVEHTGQLSRLSYFRTIVKAKALLWFVKGRYEGRWVSNLIRSRPPDKQAHEWAQSPVEATDCIKRLTPPAGIVVDPMCGSGTTLRAALFLGRRTLGCEIDPHRSKVAAVRCDLRAEAASFNPPGWTPWRRVVWLGLNGADLPARPAIEDSDGEPGPGWSCAAEHGFDSEDGGSDEADGAEPRLFVRGNHKVGKGVLVWNLPVFDTCPGKTPSCEAVCYADRGNSRWPATKRRHAKNLQAAEADNFVEKVIAEIRKRGASLVRIHSSGDFFSAAYVARWVAVAEATPGVTFWCYTRSWRVPEIMPQLERLASLPNVYVWFSCDKDSGLPAAVPNVRACWLQTEQEEPPTAGPGQLPVELVFRTRLEGRQPVKRIGLALVCPAYNGTAGGEGTTCEQCRFCFAR